MELYRIGIVRERKRVLRELGVESGGVKIMAEKMQTLWIKIRRLRTPAANILKQDALSIGADLAVPSGVITCETEYVDALLIATRAQLRTLARKERAQPFGLKRLAGELEGFLNEPGEPVKIMGVLNANEDSFYAGSRFLGEAAVERIEAMIGEGAAIIDIGGVSSRPGSEPVSAEEELERVRPICEALERSGLTEKALFSIDSYTPAVVEYALQKGFGLINDITGATDERIIALAKAYQARLCIMHMQGTPQTMQLDPHYEDVTAEVDAFFTERIEACEAAGLSRDQLILDVGIGFGKTLEHNLELLRNHANFLRHGCELLIGASRKSMIDRIIPTPTEARLPGTLAIHLKAVENGATIVRCHDVAEHRQALAVWEAIGL
ncbi:dihydropteroate synthase [Nitratifractor salsuginis]|uniref:dihydropteroate synthase n=1 Tax=Nitratifractor salsuginis (strain DSM 16511 / JCM 12458 / E9I37-1) TaxID=749222 RepID=E6X1H6_NITSE|nr:dihydropteroate synthase [Nitratifractor salsuginis]ADV45909.1 dihydropteroate synthase [Nitratifractor salsuginis DSM 16511]